MNDTPKKVLIIEDEIPMLNVLSDALKNLGYSTFKAENGEDGLRLAFQQQPNLILLDLLMPRMNGMTFMKSLRATTWAKDTPVIILTNVNPDNDDTIKSVVKYQPAYYLVKSDVKLEDILEKVKTLLGS